MQWETRPETSLLLKNDIMGFPEFGDTLGIIPLLHVP